MRLARSLVALAFVTSALVGAPAALAQSDGDIAAAKRAFKEGDDAEKRRDLPTALAKFKEALAVKETPQLILRLGGVEEKMGLLAQAMASYEHGMQKAESQGLANVAKVAREQMEAMRTRVPTVVVTVVKSYPDLAVKLDDKPLALGTKIFLDPGNHKLIAEASGYQKKEKSFSAVERDALEFQLDLAPAGGPAPITAPIDGATTDVDASARPSKLPAVVLIGAGGVALVGGVVLFLVANGKNGSVDDLCGGSDRKHCPASKKDEINSDISTVKVFQIFSGVSVGLGVAGIGVGTYLLLRKPPAAPAAGAVQVFPLVGASGNGIGISGRF